MKVIFDIKFKNRRGKRQIRMFKSKSECKVSERRRKRVNGMAKRISNL